MRFSTTLVESYVLFVDPVVPTSPAATGWCRSTFVQLMNIERIAQPNVKQMQRTQCHAC